MRRNAREEQRVELVKIHECWSAVEAEVLMSYLGSYGIRSTTSSNASPSVHPFTVDGMGKVGIWVSAADAERATEALEQRASETADEEGE